MTTALKTPTFKLEKMLAQSGRSRKQKLAALATLNLGIIGALSSEAMELTEATVAFFNGENCLWVHRQLKCAAADEIMSRGVQLADLFDVLPPAKAKVEYFKELEAIRRLCVKLLRK